ncbi:MAG TPA: hypothetical protein VKY85_14080 [Candidatus Angelobacter sp.]|nr:hypothetical protein [Candidatus Angelobacter sp.]
MAIEVVAGAMSKLRVQRSREKKRAYWREKSLKRKITRIIRGEQDMLQWLVYLESTRYEKQQESAGNQTMRAMVIRYIKNLAQITTAMSSFYVNVGLQRLLYNYRTPEAKRAYEWLTDLYPNAEAYRTVKATLINQIKGRFGDGLNICQAERGERRFESVEHQDRWEDLVKHCLKFFVPWSTRQTCLTAGFDGFLADSPAPRKRYREIAPDAREIGWSHAFIHPPCYEQLTTKVGLGSPSQRLAVPRFQNVILREDNLDDLGGGDPQLSEDELTAIVRRLGEEDLQRQKASPKSLRIMADGTPCARIDVAGPNSTFQCELDEGIKLLEIWTQSNSQNILLATHWVEYTRWESVAPATAWVDLGDGRELRIEIKPVSQPESGQRRIHLGLRCQSASTPATWRKFLQDARQACSSPVPRYALAALVLLAGGWIATTVVYQRHLRKQQAEIQQINRELAAERAANTNLQSRLGAGRPLTYALAPDELRRRGSQRVAEDVIYISPQSSLVVLELPVGLGQHFSYRASLSEFLVKNPILSESSLLPQQKGDEMFVYLEIPCDHLQSDKHYVVDLYSGSRSGTWLRIHTFRFHVVKE